MCLRREKKKIDESQSHACEVETRRPRYCYEASLLNNSYPLGLDTVVNDMIAQLRASGFFSSVDADDPRPSSQGVGSRGLILTAGRPASPGPRTALVPCLDMTVGEDLEAKLVAEVAVKPLLPAPVISARLKFELGTSPAGPRLTEAPQPLVTQRTSNGRERNVGTEVKASEVQFPRASLPADKRSDVLNRRARLQVRERLGAKRLDSRTERRAPRRIIGFPQQSSRSFHGMTVHERREGHQVICMRVTADLGMMWKNGAPYQPRNSCRVASGIWA
ncbi:hypothetical protein BJ546DRAFT_950631 [Cryomyces antarcticus]